MTMAYGYVEGIGSYVFSAAAAVLVAKVIWEFAFPPPGKFPGPFMSRSTHLWRTRAVLLCDAEAYHRQWHGWY